MTPEQEALLSEWHSINEQVKELAEKEKTLRLKVVAAMSSGEKAKGTENVSMGDGFKLKIVHRENIKLDKSTVDEYLDQIMKFGGEAEFIVKRLVSYEPKLNESEWRKMPSDLKAIFDQCVTTSPGIPAISIEKEK